MVAFCRTSQIFTFPTHPGNGPLIKCHSAANTVRRPTTKETDMSEQTTPETNNETKSRCNGSHDHHCHGRRGHCVARVIGMLARALRR
jgi:hypothetical protein